MARPRKDAPPDQFSAADMAAAGGITLRNLILLEDKALAPRPVNSGVGKAGVKAWDSFGLSHCALIGALHRQSGFELLIAAKLAKEFVEEFGSAYDRMPSGLEKHFLINGQMFSAYRSFLQSVGYNGDDFGDDFWKHHFLRTYWEGYEIGKAHKGDYGLEIVDRQYVFVIGALGTGLRYVGGRISDPSYRIFNLERGSEADVRSIVAEVGGPLSDPGPSARLKEIEAEFDNARANAVALLTVNVSLAIRNAFDAVHDRRIASGVHLNLNKTGRPEPKDTS